MSRTDSSKVSEQYAKQISTYTSLKFSGASHAFNFKKSLYIALFVVALLFSVFIAIPATSSAAIFQEPRPVFKRECIATNNYIMILAYCLSSSLLFCFTMSFLFSLCILGSPLLKGVFDIEEHTQRYASL